MTSTSLERDRTGTTAPLWLRPEFSVVVFLFLRSLVIFSAELPAIVPDEPGSWAVARWLSGAARRS